jgi:hypothetical protein
MLAVVGIGYATARFLKKTGRLDAARKPAA